MIWPQIHLHHADKPETSTDHQRQLRQTAITKATLALVFVHIFLTTLPLIMQSYATQMMINGTEGEYLSYLTSSIVFVTLTCTESNINVLLYVLRLPYFKNIVFASLKCK